MRWMVAWCLVPALAAGHLWVSTVTFQGSRGGTDVDVFIRVASDSLGTLSTPDGERVVLSFAVTVEDSSGVALLTDRWDRSLPPMPKGHEVYVLDSSSLEVPPGPYVIHVTVVDRATAHVWDERQRMFVPAYSAPGLMLSDMVFSGEAPRREAEGQFVRHGFRVIPSPDEVFGRTGLLYVYQEVYNLAPPSVGADSFVVTYTILDRSDQPVRTYTAKGKRADGPVTVKVTGLSLAGLPAGRYRLQARVEDPLTGLRTSTSRDFGIQKPAVRPRELTEEELRKASDLFTYVANARQKKLFESLDETGKRELVTRFWAEQDPDPALPGNPVLEEMMRRYDYANAHFGGHVPGWMTDRGRVYIVYGPPKEVERSTSNPAVRDYEIWTYAQEGERIFVFVDERGYGDFKLVHSTMRGEIENPAWQDLLQPVKGER